MSDTVEIAKRMEQALRETVNKWGELCIDVDYPAWDPQCDTYSSFEQRFDASVFAQHEYDSPSLYVVLHDWEMSRGNVLDNSLARNAAKSIPEYSRRHDEEQEALRTAFERYVEDHLTPLVRKTYPEFEVCLEEEGRYTARYSLLEVTK